MQLEVGKTYETRDGEAQQIAELTKNHLYAFKALSGLTYTIDGCYIGSEKRDQRDLIREVASTQQARVTDTDLIEELPTEQLQLEVGKTYEARDGSMATITYHDVNTEGDAYEFSDDDNWYTATGEYWVGKQTDFDLLREVPNTRQAQAVPTVDATPGTKPTNPKDAVGSSKPPLSCVPWAVLLRYGVSLGAIGPRAKYLIGLGMLEGACKYGRHNYRVSGVRASVYYDATMRHGVHIQGGELMDRDSGLPHLVKMLTSLLVVADGALSGNWYDDRPPVVLDRDTAYIDKLCIADKVTLWWEGDDSMLGEAIRDLVSAINEFYGTTYGGWFAEIEQQCNEILAKYPEPRQPFTELNK